MISPARRRIALAASAAGAAIVALDGGVLLVAQPSLQRDLDASVAEVQWTSTGYLVAVAALLVLAGRLGDRFGHRRLLCAGVLGFGAASAGIAVAGSVGWVIALRVAQGVFGALLQPATLALLRLAYPEDRLGRPIAVRTSALAVAAGASPVLGGLVVAHLGWRAVFWINVPVALAIALLTLAVRVPAAGTAAWTAEGGSAWPARPCSRRRSRPSSTRWRASRSAGGRAAGHCSDSSPRPGPSRCSSRTSGARSTPTCPVGWPVRCP